MSISEFKLHQLRLNRLSEDEKRSVLEELRDTGQIGLLEELIEQDAAFLERFPPEIEARKIEAKVRRSQVESQVSERRQPVLWFKAAAVVAVAGLMALTGLWLIKGNDRQQFEQPKASSASLGSLKTEKSVPPPKENPIQIGESKRLIFAVNEKRPFASAKSLRRIRIGTTNVFKVSSESDAIHGEALKVGTTEVTLVSAKDTITDYFVTVGQQYDGALTDVLTTHAIEKLGECGTSELPNSVRIYFDQSGMIYDVELTDPGPEHVCIRQVLRGATMSIPKAEKGAFAADLPLDFLK